MAEVCRLHSGPLLLTGLIAGLLAACSASGDPAPRGDAAVLEDGGRSLTYHRDLRPIVARHCLACHRSNGIAGFSLDGYSLLRTFGSAARAAVEERRMPPWMPSPSCRGYRSERVLSDAEIAAFGAWIDGGMIEGDPSDFVPPDLDLPPDPGPPTVVLGSERPYASPPMTDDYRCFPLAQRFDRETFLRGTRVVPDQPEVVHHVLIYLVPSEQSALIDSLDAAEPGPGYTCFGGPGAGTPRTVGAWVPGSPPAFMAADTAIRIAPGSRLVMQIHYNTIFSEPTADQTQVALWLDEVTPSWLIDVRPLANLGIDIQPGDAASGQSRTFQNNSERAWTIAAVGPHMHLLGSRITARALDPGGTETCLIDIPRWDFHWQQSYVFREGETVTVPPGGSVRLDCTYDNSAGNQPVVNGERLAPREVTWGEGTLDEMCLLFMALVEPYTPLPTPADTCPGYGGCLPSCLALGPPFGTPALCALQCSNTAGPTCARCVFPALGSCAVPTCPGVVERFARCIESCQRESLPQACASERCGTQILAFDGCVTPLINAGTCDGALQSCGASR